YRAAACRVVGTIDPARRRDALIKAARAAILADEPLPDDLPLDETVTVAGEDMTVSEAIARWRAAAKRSRKPTVASVLVSAMKHDRLRLQEAPLALRKWQAGWQRGRRGWNPKMTAAFVPYVLSGDRSQVFVNTSEMLCAIDPVVERLLWTRGPSEPFMAELLPPGMKKVTLVNTPKRFYTATSADTVFFRLNWAHRVTEATRSVIFAARRSDGVLRWSTEGLPELAGMRFVSDPAYADGTVVAMAWEPREIPVFHLVGLDAVTGELLWKTHLLSGTMFPAVRGAGLMDSPLGAPPPTIAGGAVYLAASVGVMACVDLFDGHVRWLQTYPRVYEYGRVDKDKYDDKWSGRFIFNRPNAPVAVRANLVLAAPQDVRGILFFDAENGALLRQYDSIDFRVMIGADDARAYVQQGGSVVAVKLEDASVAWETSLPTSMVIGSPALSDRGIICSTSEGIFVLSPDDGRIVDHHQAAGWEPIGNPLDLGDRIVAVSPVAVHLFAPEVNGGRDWSLPRSPSPDPLTVEVLPPAGLTRWVLRAPDRGDFFFSEHAPNLMVTRSWETFQLRRLAPAPTLLWEYAGPSWPRTIQFDDKVVLFDYTGGHLLCVDVKTGKARWELRDRAMAGERGTSGAIVAGDLAVWFTHNRVQGVHTRDGQSAWSVAFAGMTVRGICPHARGIGVFLENGPEPLAVLLDRKTGGEIRRIPLVKAHKKDKKLRPLRCARMDGQNVVAVQPIALIDGRQIAMVDFATGRVELGKVDGSQGAADLVRCGDVLCMMGEGKLVAACSLPDFKPLSVHKGGFWRVADGVEYYVNGPRVAAWDMATGEPLWQSRAFTWRTRLLVVAGKTLLAAQDLEDKHDPRARVIAIDRANGDVLAEVEALGLNFH
ncbi:MAG TPA: PQQ-binding-like beta-propeller repeat protein, partial [Phycisphaerae bacterium]|nr:PQQ-binding-like beta-propeller repeat protein [Phycisphaerae bacterium]